MARYVGTVTTGRSVDDVFAYMADVRNFAEWDPGTRHVTQVEGDGPGVGARYDVEVQAGPRAMALPYRMTSCSAPDRVVLQGATRWMRLRDEITVAPAAGGGASVTYEARVELQGALRIVEPVFARLFRRTGDRAAAGLAATLGGAVM